jgi:metal-responsive CopG/Arc/MetJ family transcriptional regulator
MYAMKRTTIFLDEQTLQRLQRTAQRQGVSAAMLVREAVTRYLDTPPAANPLPSIAGQFTSEHPDTAERVDALLWRDPHA